MKTLLNTRANRREYVAESSACSREDRVYKAFSVDHHGRGDARLSHVLNPLSQTECDYVQGQTAPLAVPQLGPCASSARVMRHWASAALPGAEAHAAGRPATASGGSSKVAPNTRSPIPPPHDMKAGSSLSSLPSSSSFCSTRSESLKGGRSPRRPPRTRAGSRRSRRPRRPRAARG